MTQHNPPVEEFVRASDRLPYPIVEMRDLHRPPRTGPFGFGPRMRHDLPRPRQGHFTLVYKVDNRYVVDNMSLRPGDDKVVNASQVTVVDLTRQKPVEVELAIPSRDHSMFTIVVTFRCSVEDPIAVVSGGITDPAAILLTYLKSHHEYSQMGLGFRIAEVNEARKFINAQLTAYATVSEPAIEGMRVEMASVEVRTPKEEEDLAATQRGMRTRHVIESESVDLDGDLRTRRIKNEHLIDRLDRGNRHERRMSDQLDEQEHDAGARRYRHLTEDEDQLRRIEARQRERVAEEAERVYSIEARRQELVAELEQRGMTEKHTLAALREAAELLRDPVAAMQVAYLSGQLNGDELARRMQSLEERREELSQKSAAEQREADRQARLDEASDRRAQLDFDREMKREELKSKRAQAEHEAAQSRIDQAIARERELAELKWAREDAVAERKADEDRERRVYEARVEMGKKIVDRGLLDTTSQNLEDILRLDANGMPVLGGNASAALPDQPAAHSGAPTDDTRDGDERDER